jgi:hypothetical protein
MRQRSEKGYLAIKDWKTVPKLHYLMLFTLAQAEIGTEIEAQVQRFAQTASYILHS